MVMASSNGCNGDGSIEKVRKVGLITFCQPEHTTAMDFFPHDLSTLPTNYVYLLLNHHTQSQTLVLVLALVHQRQRIWNNSAVGWRIEMMTWFVVGLYG